MSGSRWIAFAVSFSLAIAFWPQAASMADDPAESSQLSSADVAYQAPESFPSRGVGDDFIAYAKRFLTEHPQHESSPRAASDLLMVGTIRGDAALIELASAKLAFEYTASLQTLYWLTTFAHNNGQYRTFLQAQFEKMAPTLDAESSQKFCRAVEIGARFWGLSFLAGDDLLLQTALAADVGGALNLKTFCRERLLAASPEIQEVAEISLSDKPEVNKFLALAKISDSKPARQHQSYYLRQLSDEDRELLDVRRAIAEAHLSEGKFAEALPVVESLLAETPTDEYSFWKAWCLAAKGKDRAAIAELGRLASKYPDSPYLPAAAELTSALSSMVANVFDHSKSLFKAIEQMRSSSLKQVEIELTYAPKNQKPVDVYLAYDGSVSEKIEIVARRGVEVLLAFRSSPQNARMFVQGDPTIAEFATGAYLLPQFRIVPGPDGQHHFFWQCNIHNAPGGAESAFASLLTSPLFSSQEMVSALMRDAVTRGAFPAGAEQSDGEWIYSWLSPVVGSTELERAEFSIDDSGNLASWRRGQVHFKKIRCGDAGDFEFSSAAWPDLPKTDHKQFDAAAMFRLLGAMTSIMQEKARE